MILKSQKLLVGCIYRPSNDKKFLQRMSVIIKDICHRSNILLLGDFNIDLFDSDKPLTRTFKQILAEYNLVNVIREYTRITVSSKSLIDHAITANPSKILKSGTYGTGISDHDLIFVILKLSQKMVPSKLISVQNYRNVDTQKIKNDLEAVPWHIIEIFDDVDDSLWCWQSLFNQVVSDHVKTQKVKVRGNNQPWMTGDLRKMINNRYKLLMKARGTPHRSKEREDYKRARNACTNLMRYTKAIYWKSKFISSDSPKSFWSLVKKFNGDSNVQRIGPLKNDDNIVTKDDDKSNLLNNFFADIGKKLATPPEVDSDGNMNSYVYRISPAVSEINLSTDLFTKLFRAAVRVGKACGPDNITAKDLKLHPESSIVGLQKVAKCSLLSGRFPSKWKKSKVTAIHKKGCKSDCSNYRPISLLSIPSKVVEHLVCSQLNTHLREHNLQTEHQWVQATKVNRRCPLTYVRKMEKSSRLWSSRRCFIY